MRPLAHNPLLCGGIDSFKYSTPIAQTSIFALGMIIFKPIGSMSDQSITFLKNSDLMAGAMEAAWLQTKTWNPVQRDHVRFVAHIKCHHWPL